MAAREPGGPLTPFEYQTGPLGPDEVDIEVRGLHRWSMEASMLVLVR